MKLIYSMFIVQQIQPKLIRSQSFINLFRTQDFFTHVNCSLMGLNFTKMLLYTRMADSG